MAQGLSHVLQIVHLSVRQLVDVFNQDLELLHRRSARPLGILIKRLPNPLRQLDQSFLRRLCYLCYIAHIPLLLPFSDIVKKNLRRRLKISAYAGQRQQASENITTVLTNAIPIVYIIDEGDGERAKGVSRVCG